MTEIFHSSVGIENLSRYGIEKLAGLLGPRRASSQQPKITGFQRRLDGRQLCKKRAGWGHLSTCADWGKWRRLAGHWAGGEIQRRIRKRCVRRFFVAIEADVVPRLERRDSLELRRLAEVFPRCPIGFDDSFRE